MTWFVRVVLIVAAMVHLLPAVAILGPSALTRLYGVRVSDRDTALLLRHRAALFAIVRGLMVAGVVAPPLTTTALVVGMVSTSSYLLLYWQESVTSAALKRVAWIDVPVAAGLTLALIGHLLVGA